MSLNRILQARSWASRSLASLLAGFVLGVSAPSLAFAQAASAPAEAPKAEAPAAPAEIGRAHV